MGLMTSLPVLDLGDRAIFLTLAPIPDTERRSQQELWRDFERAKPRILGDGCRSAWLATVAESTRACRGWLTSGCGVRLFFTARRARRAGGPPASRADVPSDFGHRRCV